MNRIVLGALIALALTGLGLFWWQGRAEVERGAPPPQPAEASANLPEIPASDPGDMVGPAPPEATELTKEQRSKDASLSLSLDSFNKRWTI